jgi:hypothetical protein
MNLNAAFEWKCQPQAENLLLAILDRAITANPVIAQLQKDLLEQTSTRLFDWIDHVIIQKSTPQIEEQLQEVGFVIQGDTAKYCVYYHPGAQLPRVVIYHEISVEGIAVAVESIADFLLARGGANIPIEGSPLGHFRRACVNTTQDISLWVIERRGTFSLEPQIENVEYERHYLQASERWANRPRSLEDEDEAMNQALQIAGTIVDDVGQNLAAWIILDVERKYWQMRNTAAQLQKNRQDHLGMGWANHDHHTFRSSRKTFSKLVRLFEMLGFQCRERFYAGKEAGWGAQVMENPICRLVLFLDVDLAAHEVEQDFSHEGLSELPQLGTIGLWCALHGNSILQAGMHHLEAQFMFENLTEDLAKSGIKMMNPFSSFPYLRQAFTAGEKWAVNPKRVQALVKNGKISQAEAERFLAQGAIGSHLENLQRREGYKGFNQKNVSLIIKKTDPREQNI